MYKLKFKKAFTLIELVICLAALGVMYSFSSASFDSYREMSLREQQKLDIQQVKNAVDNYYSANSKYPTAPLDRQPSPDIKEGSNVIRGYSPVDIDKLVAERYLQQAPKVGKGEFFAVDISGIVTIEKGESSNLIVADGAITIGVIPNNTIPVVFYTNKSNSGKTVTIQEVNSSYGNLSGGKSIQLPINADGRASGNIQITATPGSKYFKAKVNGGVGEARARVEYGMSAESDAVAPYWYSSSANVVGTTTPVTISQSDIKISNKIEINFTDYELKTGGSRALRYEVVKEEFRNGSFTEVNKEPIKVSSTKFIDEGVKGGTKYRYKIFAIAGNGKKTSNYLLAEPSKNTDTFSDNAPYIDNFTKDDFATAYNKDITVRVGDADGVDNVTLYIAQVMNGVVQKDFKAYGMNKTKDGSSTVTQNNIKLQTDVYSVPVEVLDDYLLYYVKVTDKRGNEFYNYVDNTLTKNKGESDSDFEKRRKRDSYNAPSKTGNHGYTLMRGLVEIHNDTFADDSKIDNANSNYHLFDGKVTLP